MKLTKKTKNSAATFTTLLKAKEKEEEVGCDGNDQVDTHVGECLKR